MADGKEIELDTKPYDGISCLTWSPANPNHLLVGSWDSSLRLYNAQENSQLAKFDHKAGVLGACFSQDASAVFSGGLDTWVRRWNIEREEATVLGTHSRPISAVVYSGMHNLLLTGSWDSTIAMHDPRSGTPSSTRFIPQPERVYNMDAAQNTVVVAMAGRKINIYDLRRMDRPTQERESSLRFMTRALACNPDGEGYALGSIEGRVAVEYFDPSPEAQAKKYAFKCHRKAVDGADHVWGVNSLAFHPVYHTFASAGSDGIVSVWDHAAKKRLRQYQKYHNAVNAVAFNKTGTKLAVGVSYGWDNGQEGSRLPESNKVSIFVREVGDEYKPKASSKK